MTTRFTHTQDSLVRHLADVRAEAAMHRGLIKCDAGAPMTVVARVMAAHRIHCVVVPTPGPQGWGIVSDLDLVDAVHARAMSERTAGDTAARRTLSVGASDTLERAARLMHEFRESHLVVVDPASSAAVGVLSTLDVADALAEITTWEA